MKEKFEIIDPQRVRQLTERELTRYVEANPRSAAAWRAASAHLIGGVGSSYQLFEPFPIVIESGSGSTIVDADGQRRIDYHNAFGSMVQGHAHPLITETIETRAAQGTHFSAANRDAGIVADLLALVTPAPRRRWMRSGSLVD
jgi:glutamate-1-semialdehyde 2,1-aminomutase